MGIYIKARERFDYNPLTGNLVYIEDTLRNKIGDAAGHIDAQGYRVINVKLNNNRTIIYAHRLAFYIMEGCLPECVDHIDGKRANNRWFNLRGCTHAENMRNRRMNSRNTSGYRGVVEHQGKWRGQLELNGKQHTRAGFLTPELANEWVVARSKEAYGEFYNENIKEG